MFSLGKIMPSMHPTNTIGYMINHLAFMLSRQSDQLLQDSLDIGFSQFKILMILQWAPNVKQKHIAEKLGQTEASVSRQIKLLSDYGLLETKQHPTSRRENITTLTRKGEKTASKAVELLNSHFAPVFEGLGETQFTALQTGLSALHDELCEQDGVTGCKLNKMLDT